MRFNEAHCIILIRLIFELSLSLTHSVLSPTLFIEKLLILNKDQRRESVFSFSFLNIQKNTLKRYRIRIKRVLFRIARKIDICKKNLNQSL